jgi:hypothetical protein
MPYWKELKYNDPEEIEGPDDVVLPSTLHHMQAKAELNVLVGEGILTDAQAQQVMKRWRAKNELGDERISAAIDVLEDNGLLDESEAEGLRQQVA